MASFRRIGLALAAGTVAVITAASPSLAGATATASGSFYHQDLLGGAGQINNPTLGVCYSLPSAGVTGYNDTNATATVFTDRGCLLSGFPTPPHNQVNATLFGSVRFTAAP